MEEHATEVGQVLDHLLEYGPGEEVDGVDFKFFNPDINYLSHRRGVDHKVVARMIRTFGEAVVLESLRRLEEGWMYPLERRARLFVGICKVVAETNA